MICFAETERKAMISKDRKDQKPRDAMRDGEDQSHAPAGRGGTAMGRTVGLPYGGARARKRRAAKPAAGKKRINKK